MLIDAIALVALGAAVFHGLRRGALAPLLLLGAAVASVLAAQGLEPALRSAVLLVLPEATPATRQLVGTLAAGLGLYALLAVGIHVGVRLVRSSGCLIRWVDGVAGMAFGLLRATLLLVFALWLLARWTEAQAPAEEAPAMATLRAQAERSLGVRLARQVPWHVESIVPPGTEGTLDAWRGSLGPPDGDQVPGVDPVAPSPESPASGSDGDSEVDGGSGSINAF